MDIVIRRGETGDLERLAAFLQQLFMSETDFAADTAKNRAGLGLLLMNPEAGTIFVAEAAGIVVGMVTAQLVVSTSAGGYSILLEDMYVAPGYRRKGVASRLLAQALAWGSERNARRIQLVAAEANTGALWFYRQAGLRKSQMTALYGLLDNINLNSG